MNNEYLNLLIFLILQVLIQKEFIKEERKKHLQRKESLRNVETKKVSVGGLKDKLARRKSRKSTVAPVPENQSEASNAQAANQSEANNTLPAIADENGGNNNVLDDDEFR